MNVSRAIMVGLGLAALAWGGAQAGSADGALPQGPGRETTVRVCTACHDAEVIVHRTQKEAAWPDVVQAMVEKGAEASTGEQAEIAAYLQRTLPSGR